MKTSIIYNSHSGTTSAYTEKIGNFLSSYGIEYQVSSINYYDKEYLISSDLVLLGCWTSGLMIVAQHPDRAWKKFALFTTYTIATGSMFRKMENILNDKCDPPNGILKSKSKQLTDMDRSTLKDLINS